MASGKHVGEGKVFSPTPKRISIELDDSPKNKFLDFQGEQPQDRSIWGELSAILGKPDYPMGLSELLKTPSPPFEDIPSRVSLNPLIYDDLFEVSV